VIWRIGGVIVALCLLYALAEVVWRGLAPHPAGLRPAQAPGLSAPAAKSGRPVSVAGPGPAPAAPPPPLPPLPPCRNAAGFEQAAARNGDSVFTAAWSVFGRAETGWAIYAPLAAHEIATACSADAEGFAQALSAWQAGRGMPASGIMDEATLDALRLVWLRRRPFVAATAHGDCPPPPAPERLVWARPDEGYLTKPIQLRSEALAAYRAMIIEARASLPELAADHRLLTVFSGFRDPAGDAARCETAGDCGTIARARCSAHRTGLAMDIFVGAAPGYVPESSADPNRLHQSRSAAYRWMVANAERFGFRNYAFEPWHWEWTGAAAD
jgi:D-alanyl-D-alanine carboxypeptidase